MDVSKFLCQAFLGRAFVLVAEWLATEAVRKLKKPKRQWIRNHFSVIEKAFVGQN